MKKKIVIFTLVMAFMLANTSMSWAIQQAEIRQGKDSIAYNVQKLNGEIKALNLEGDFGLTPTLGVSTNFSYLNDDDNILDINLKLKIVDEYDFNLTGLVGYHTRFNGEGKNQIGMLFSKRQSEFVNLNAGFNVLLDQPHDSLGYEVGADYMLSNDWFLEFGFKKIAGEEDTGGLTFGLRNYL
ncbi:MULTISPECIES: outer membrane beta-barrel protein [unclassified Candidatus Frackibacter]|uniref:outer membrane beta-barrel protein n=1 Tax=unclassified Candidatus Frackibacter TaxID=2648818 RepID=UPI000886AE2A|nr:MULTISPECIES: outer membrane beta-barrel protein [unclassified Candidatus Frackibacter]SDC71857.1 Outer membrane protein beta-barrel domain-containing protein [Candidatus Frackibacter sp. WG11]SEM86155.1 Outer membrane protein beta-barrel domain-containing protein [Candidatus Frackibacter sp. WG12]SFL95246.1 Outer membrane protein beta-barrel domain-containing protein [Candidatus Frackibacter sp. WG13]